MLRGRRPCEPLARSSMSSNTVFALQFFRPVSPLSRLFGGNRPLGWGGRHLWFFVPFFGAFFLSTERSLFVFWVLYCVDDTYIKMYINMYVYVYIHVCLLPVFSRLRLNPSILRQR